MSSDRVVPGLKVSAHPGRCRIDVFVCKVSNKTAINFPNIIIGVSLQSTDWRSVSVGLSVTCNRPISVVI